MDKKYLWFAGGILVGMIVAPKVLNAVNARKG